MSETKAVLLELSHIVEALAPYEDLIFDVARKAEKEADAPALESERTR